MSNKVVNSANAPAAVGPYSHSIVAGDTQYISGQLGIDPATGNMRETVTEQATQSLENMGAILKESGMDFSNVVKTTVLLADIADFAEVNKIYGTYFASNPPARSCFQVAALPMGGLVEIEAIAVK